MFGHLTRLTAIHYFEVYVRSLVVEGMLIFVGMVPLFSSTEKTEIVGRDEVGIGMFLAYSVGRFCWLRSGIISIHTICDKRHMQQDEILVQNCYTGPVRSFNIKVTLVSVLWSQRAKYPLPI